MRLLTDFFVFLRIILHKFTNRFTDSTVYSTATTKLVHYGCSNKGDLWITGTLYCVFRKFYPFITCRGLIHGHLAVLSCIWCLQLSAVLFCTCEFYLLFVWFMCFMCVWCVYYVFYVYMGQVPEIKLMMMNTISYKISRAYGLSRSMHYNKLTWTAWSIIWTYIICTALLLTYDGQSCFNFMFGRFFVIAFSTFVESSISQLNVVDR